MHVDEFIDKIEPGLSESEKYAAFVLNWMRMPAYMHLKFLAFMKNHLLYCSFEGKRHRVNVASRFGDIGITEDLKKENGYDKRVDIAKCSEWGDEP